MLWKYYGHNISKKKICGAEIEGKEKSGKLICGNGIVEIEGKKWQINHNKVICGNGIAKNTLTNWVVSTLKQGQQSSSSSSLQEIFISAMPFVSLSQ